MYYVLYSCPYIQIPESSFLPRIFLEVHKWTCHKLSASLRCLCPSGYIWILLSRWCSLRNCCWPLRIPLIDESQLKADQLTKQPLFTYKRWSSKHPTRLFFNVSNTPADTLRAWMALLILTQGSIYFNLKASSEWVVPFSYHLWEHLRQDVHHAESMPFYPKTSQY